MKVEDKEKLRKYFDGKYTREEAIEVIHRIIRDEDDAELKSMAQEVWNDVYDVPDEVKIKQYKEEAHQLVNRFERRNQMNRLRRTAIAILSTAAAVCIVVWGVSMLMQFNGKSLFNSYLTLSTGYGEQKSLTLSDGSVVTLNACSSLQYPSHFNGDKRDVKLNGEAFFQVRHNPQKPFYIRLKKFEVKVLGTQFDVKSYQEDQMASVAVRTGKVQVNLPSLSTSITTSEEVRMNDRGGCVKQKVYGNVASWQAKKLTFYNTPIRDVAHELERAFHCTVMFRGDKMWDDVITGEYDMSSLEDIIKSVAFITDSRYAIENQKVTFYI